MKRPILLFAISLAVAMTAGLVRNAFSSYQREMSLLLSRNIAEERNRIGDIRASRSLLSFAAKWPRRAGLDRATMSEEDLKRYGIALFVFLEGTTEPFFWSDQLGMVQHVAQVEYRGDGAEKKLAKSTVFGYRGGLMLYEFWFDEKTVIGVSLPRLEYL